MKKHGKEVCTVWFFRNSVEPAFCVTYDADITNFLQQIRKQNFSFTLAFVYAVCKCANEIDAFRYRFLDGVIVLFDKIDTAFTYLNKDTVKVVNVPMLDTMKEYVEMAAQTAKEQKEYFTGGIELKEIEVSDYELFVEEIKDLIHKKQYQVLKLINAETINLYWEIGEEIHRQQEENGWGKSIVQVLSKELQKEFPGAKGYSAANLWRMRNFYLSYCNSEKLAPLVREISWSNNVVIMEKCKDDLQREFYIQMAKRYGWTKRILTNFIEAQTYEKYLSNQTLI